MSAAISALGAIIGYIGAEVVQASVFERLLWPERFHNYLSTSTLLKLAVFGSMSGPLHRAALETLDGFRDKGLYKGFMRGDMLGAAFFANREGMGYYHRTAKTPEDRKVRKEVRNGFWVEVLSHVNHCKFKAKHEERPSVESDCLTHEGWKARKMKIRAMRPIFRLNLEFCPGVPERAAASAVVSEQRITLSTVISVIASETSSILFAVATTLLRHLQQEGVSPPAWYIGFLLIPLLLKLVILLFTVRRTELVLPPSPPKQHSVDIREKPLQSDSGDSKTSTEIFQVDYPALGFILISTKGPIESNHAAFQFFRHYGHPLRSSYLDRTREILSILIVYLTGLYFPTGLILLSWMNDTTQYLWLSQQVYTVVAAHVVRLAGLQGYGRTEERLAKQLGVGEGVWLVGEEGALKAILEVEEVSSVKEGEERVSEILRANEG